MDVEQIAAIGQAGGLLVFAFAVWQELRSQRTERAASELRHANQMTAIQVAIVEFREAIRDLGDSQSRARRRTRPSGIHKVG